jgi:predicted porin
MKKSLIALAALAATGAFAQSSVQIDGVMDVGLTSIDYKGNKVSGIANNGSSTSQINFRGTEDLGGGLKANFRVETDWNTVSNSANAGTASTIATPVNSTAGTFGNGELRVGLTGGFGTIDAGAVNYNSLISGLVGQPFGTAIGSGFGATSARLVRSDNSINYKSPSFGGLTVSLYNAQKQTKATGSDYSATFGAYDFTGSDEVNVSYNNGPIAASYTNLKQKAATGVNTTFDTLGANYTMGAVKLYALVQEKKTSNNSDKTSYASVSAAYTMGATTLMAQFGELKDKQGANSGLKSKLSALGADYALSKRTAVYARYESIDDKAGVAANPATLVGTNSTRTRTAVGVRHAF